MAIRACLKTWTGPPSNPIIESAVNHHANAEAHRVQRKISIEERNKLLSDITESIRGCRNILSGVHMKSMQTLGEWGFNVIETNFTRGKGAKGTPTSPTQDQKPETDAKS